MNGVGLNIVGYSDTGQVREHNEDRIAMRPDIGVAVLADGMGGHRAGEVASELAVKSIVDELAHALNEAPLVYNCEGDGTEAVYLSLSALAQANTLVYQSSQDHPEHAGMGTTLVLALFAPGCITIAHVGDSRAYLLRGGKFERLTQDHSMVEEAISKGLFTLEEARRNFSKNIITRALGVGPDVDPEVQQFSTLTDDVFLLCSDGLTDLVADDELGQTLRESSVNLANTAQRLIDMANARGGVDNVSVVLAHCT